jgi:hypothetical protein
MGGSRKRNDPAKGMAPGVTPGVRAALRLLWEAYPQDGAGSDPWQDAVELAELLRVGATRVDLRHLVRDGLAEYRIEVTKPRSKRRQFEAWDNHNRSIPDGSCFVLTQRGVPVAQEVAAEGDGQPAGRRKPARRVNCPRWDGDCRLHWGKEVIKELGRTAPEQMRALNEFQRQEWKTEINFSAILADMGKTGIEGAQWIEDTVRDLNRGLRRIKFHMDCKGRTISWGEIVGRRWTGNSPQFPTDDG